LKIFVTGQNILENLYKYIRYRTDFFKEPKIRITQRSALNDPFECLPPANQVADFYDRISSNFKKDGHDVTEIEGIGWGIRTFDSTILYEFTDLFNHYGIVSLSQNFDNILMWSHYACQHSGLVIELDIENIGLENKIIHSIAKLSNPKYPQAIIYDQNRNVKDDGGTSFDYLFDSLLVKSVHWNYENEFRIVAYLKDATEVRIKKKSMELLKENNYDFFFDLKKADDDYLILSLNKNAFQQQKNYDFGDNPEKMRSNMMFNAYSSLAEHQSTIFLYDLPKIAIKRVILGCNMHKQAKEEIYKDIALYNNKVEIVEAERHPNRFELNFRKWNANKKT
jgi:hypothetical protein